MASDRKKEYIYRGAGFPVKLIGFPTKKMAGEVVLDVDTDELDLAIVRLVLLKPAFLKGAEIRFLRHFLGESLAVFAEHFDVSAPGVKRWEDLKEKSMGSTTTDFAIRNYVAKRLSFEYEMHINFAVHKSILLAGEYWKPDHIEIPFEAMAKFARDRMNESRVQGGT